MKIGILNLPFDNNYGGNLQRYALVKVLQDMGHDVECIFMYPQYRLPWYKIPYSYPKRYIKKLLGKSSMPIRLEKMCALNAEKKNKLSLQFYNKYIPHTAKITTMKELKRIADGRYDAFIVGSDQVWRADMTKRLKTENYFFDFLEESSTKRIAYAVSLGTDVPYEKSLVKKLTPLYKRFASVTVREYSALDLFKSYGWQMPKAQWVLDPTMLLPQEHYKSLIESAQTTNYTEGKIFCYILDKNGNTQKIIDDKKKNWGLECYEMGLQNSITVSIEQWLRNVMQSKFVITDSFHGVVFSILFNRPFIFVGNKKRGNARIESLYKMFDIVKDKTETIQWQQINILLEQWRERSFNILINI